MRRLAAGALVLLLFFQAAAVLAVEPPKITARSAILLDQATGRILFSKNAYEQLPMASTTKIMTAILALESGRLSDVVKVSEYAAGIGGSSVDLDAGEEKTLEELAYGLILRSGNDAATAIAEHLAGSVEKFARKMTERAKVLGAVQSNFMNPHGLHHEDHYTTAFDMAVITAHAMTIPKFKEISTTEEIRISWPGRPYDRLLRNQNRLLSTYEGADGVKTGWTTPAGRCFVGSATRDGWQLISVVLNAPQMWEDTEEMLDFGYSFYRWHTVLAAGQPVKTADVKGGTTDRVSLVAGREVALPLKEDEAEYLRFHFNLNEPLAAPLRVGREAGSLDIYFGDQLVDSVPLLAGETVEKRGIIHFIRKLFQRRALSALPVPGR
ncbi:MAG: D-alanyl-D-alanine carboxypeptidase [Dethiobacter sp.]|jgi:D-alanyl-D-alanine carboxypeptidase (penicillin-binding protein 5/6)|nr:D-alanyl-D-alanine carboxypeptidase [Dethiobacter sp.]